MKYIMLFFLLTVNSYAQCECDTVYAVGDSVTYGWGVPVDDNFVSLIAEAKDWHVFNKSVPGSKVAHMANQAYSIPVGLCTKTIMSGSGNDAWLFGLNQVALTLFKPGLKSVLSYLAIPQNLKVLGISPEVSYSGQWNPIQAHGDIGKWSDTAGATATFRLTGSNILISTLLVVAGSTTGVLRVTVDGVFYGDYASAQGPGYGKNNVNYAGEQGFTPYLIEITGLTNTEHEIVLTNQVGGYVYFDWAAGISGLPRRNPKVWMGNTHHSVGMPARIPYTEAYNVLIKESIDELRLDYGLNIKFVNINKTLLPEDMQSDGTHVNLQGNQKIADKFLEIMP